MPTSNYSFPYPSASTAPNIPLHIQQLADAVDTELDRVEGLVASDNNTTYTVSSTTVTGGARINLIGSDSNNDYVDIKGSGVTVTADSDTLITITSSATDLDSLTDVIITSPATNSFLQYNGTSWIDSGQTLVLSGNTTIGSSTHTVEFITSGNTSVTLPTSGTLATTSGVISPTIVDAKGDLIVATAADTVARLAVGTTNGYVLTVDSSEATGLKWAEITSGSSTLDGLTDVDTTGAETNYVLTYNGTIWIPQAVSGSGVDTNYYPSEIVFNAGTTAGPTLDLTMSGSGAPDLTAVAIPSASDTASGVVTTASQTFAGAKTFTGNIITSGDVAINGGDITSSAIAFNILNTTVLTANLLGEATTISIGAATGTTTLNNASVIVTGDLAINGGDLTTSASTFNILNTTATTVNAFGAGTAVTIGATTGTTQVRNLQLGTTTSTTEGRIAWDATNDKLIIGDGSTLREFVPSNIAGAGSSVTLSSNNYNLATTDRDKLIEVSNTVATTVTVDTGLDTLPVGSQIHILQTGSGQVTVTASGTTINATPGLKLRAQWSGATLIKRASNTWVLMGDLSA